jgi:hypothetical protein
MLVTLLAALPALTQDGWTALPLPSLSRPAPVELVGAALEAGSHLELDSPRRGPTSTPTSFGLPIASLIELLEQDARRAGTELRCLRTAPPLLARGSAEGLARARALLEDLDLAGRSQQVVLEVTLTPAGAAPRTYTQTVRSGEGVTFGIEESHGFLADFDVDVASGGGTANPVFGRALTGERVLVRAWRTPDGKGAFLIGTLDLSELTSIGSADPGSTDLGKIDVPYVRSVVARFSGRIDSGKELGVSVSGAPLARPDWTLTVRATTEPVATATWRVAELAWLESALPDAGDLPVPGAGLFVLERHDFDQRALEPLSSAILWGELEASFAARRAERPLFAVAPGIIVAPAADERIWMELDGLLDAAQRSRSATHAVEVRAGALVVRTMSAEGVDLRVQAGEERTALIDFDTEIAPEYWMAEPRVARVFDGVMVQARLVGSELLGSWWESASGEARELGRDAVLHGSVALPTRTLRSGPVRLQIGAHADLSDRVRIGVDAW